MNFKYISFHILVQRSIDCIHKTMISDSELCSSTKSDHSELEIVSYQAHALFSYNKIKNSLPSVELTDWKNIFLYIRSLRDDNSCELDVNNIESMKEKMNEYRVSDFMKCVVCKESLNTNSSLIVNDENNADDLMVFIGEQLIQNKLNLSNGTTNILLYVGSTVT